ncbi:unnamed protein product [Arctogadus glacialis]
MSGLPVGCLLLLVCVTAVALEIRGNDARVRCSQGLSDCRVSDWPMDAWFEPVEGKVVVQGVQARAQLCCRNRRQCTLCLAVELQIHIPPQPDTSEDHGGGGRPTNGSVRVCCETQTTQGVCHRVRFTLHPDALPLSSTTQLSLEGQPVCAPYGSTALLSVQPCRPPCPFLALTLPSLDDVCSPALLDSIEECDVPRITAVFHPVTGLGLELGGRRPGRPALLCLLYEADGHCRSINTTTIPLWAVTTCMCLQAWWPTGDQTRRAMSCPFTNHTEALIQRNEDRNLSVSLALVERSGALLLWNLSGPCRLAAQVWPCRPGQAGPHHGCKEIRGLRNASRLETSNWRQTQEGRWEISGAFNSFDLRFPPCVMVKVNRMKHDLGPFCINTIPTASRWRWNLLIIAMVTLILLAVLLLYSQHNKIKTVRGQALVLSPPDAEEGLCELVCGLGSSLREQGLGVSVDQWSRAELCSLGPLPWLYAQLLRLEKQGGGGRVVLVLTRGALQRAHQWTCLSGREEDPLRTGPPATTAPSPYSDVFWACLACVAGARGRGQAGERFLLVDFEACPRELAWGGGPLPELLEGLSVFRLPSQSQALLLELTRGAATHTKAQQRTASGPEMDPLTHQTL